MKFTRSLVSRLKAFTLLRIGMENYRMIDFRQRLEQLYKRTYVVSVDRSEVWNIQTLKHLAGRQGHPNAFLDSLNRLIDTLTYDRHML